MSESEQNQLKNINLDLEENTDLESKLSEDLIEKENLQEILAEKDQDNLGLNINSSMELKSESKQDNNYQNLLDNQDIKYTEITLQKLGQKKTNS